MNVRQRCHTWGHRGRNYLPGHVPSRYDRDARRAHAIYASRWNTDEDAAQELRRLGKLAQPALRHVTSSHSSWLHPSSIYFRLLRKYAATPTLCASRLELFSVTCVLGYPGLFGTIQLNKDAVIHLFEMSPPCFGQGAHPKHQEPDIAPAPRCGAHSPEASCG